MRLALPGFEREVAIVTTVLRRGGNLLLPYYGHPRGAETKEDGSPVTREDRESSRLICSVLEREFPRDGILDEERTEDESRFQRRRCWFADPLDDTKGYMEGSDFGLIVGLTEDFQPVFGATYRPPRDEMVVAVRGQGAYVIHGNEWRRLHVSDSDKIHVLVSKSRRSEELEAMLKDLEPDSITYRGGSLKTVDVAKVDGTVFLCPTTSTMHLWDLCGPSVILEEAGGRITDRYGNSFDYQSRETANYRGVVATNGRIHDHVLKRINR